MPYIVLIAADQQHVRHGAVALLIALTVVVAAPLGLLLSAAVLRELEGTLLLLVVVGLQMLIDPAKTSARLLPFWSGREIGTYAVDHADAGYLVRGIVHGGVRRGMLPPRGRRLGGPAAPPGACHRGVRLRLPAGRHHGR